MLLGKDAGNGEIGIDLNRSIRFSPTGLLIP